MWRPRRSRCQEPQFWRWLQTWLAGIAKVTRVDFDRWGSPEQLAFLINAYNAWTIELVLTG